MLASQNATMASPGYSLTVPPHAITDSSSRSNTRVTERRSPALEEPRLSGLEPAKPLSTSSADEELLDIPAFLRRQAN